MRVCICVRNINMYNRWRPANRYGTAAIPADATAAADQRTTVLPTRTPPHTPPPPRTTCCCFAYAGTAHPSGKHENKNKIKHDPQDVACPNVMLYTRAVYYI